MQSQVFLPVGGKGRFHTEEGGLGSRVRGRRQYTAGFDDGGRRL